MMFIVIIIINIGLLYTLFYYKYMITWTSSTMHIIDIWIIEVLFNGSSNNQGSTLFITHTKCRLIQLMYYSYMIVHRSL